MHANISSMGAFRSSPGERPSAQIPPEQTFAHLRRHGVGLTGTGVRLVLIAGVFGYVLAGLPLWLAGKPQLMTLLEWLLIGVATLLMITMVLRRFRKWCSMGATITDRRVLIRSRARKPGWDIPLLSIVDVTTSSGMLARIFGVGDLVIRTSFAQQVAVVPDVASAQAIRRDLLTLRAQAWHSYLASQRGGNAYGRTTAA